MQDVLLQMLNIISNEFKVMFTAALPVIEVRGAIPVGIALGMTPLHATILSYLGSLIPVPIILLTIRPIFNWMKETKTFKKLVENLTSRSMKKVVM
jgi:uncharacterized membrane protein